MIIITGSAGFIASNLTGKIGNTREETLVLVDDFSQKSKLKNIENKKYHLLVERDIFFNWLKKNYSDIKFIFHLGARTDTTCNDKGIFDKLNLDYTKEMWKACTEYHIPLLYASSAATYGDGSLGYEDSHNIISQLSPLNLYGESKNDLDKWILSCKNTPPCWYGMKFFNVYGPNEYHKERMASVIFHAYNQIKETGKMKLFKSHKQNIPNGQQKRDFIYVKDVVNALLHFFDKRPDSGIYNLGTGQARSFLDLAKATFTALGLEADIEFIDTPLDIRDKYQYYTEARINKLINTGYNKGFYSLEEGIRDYVINYLEKEKYY